MFKTVWFIVVYYSHSMTYVPVEYPTQQICQEALVYYNKMYPLTWSETPGMRQCHWVQKPK